MFIVEREDGTEMGTWERFTDAMKWLIAKAGEYEAAWWFPPNGDTLYRRGTCSTT